MASAANARLALAGVRLKDAKKGTADASDQEAGPSARWRTGRMQTAGKQRTEHARAAPDVALLPLEQLLGTRMLAAMHIALLQSAATTEATTLERPLPFQSRHLTPPKTRQLHANAHGKRRATGRSTTPMLELPGKNQCFGFPGAICASSHLLSTMSVDEPPGGTIRCTQPRRTSV